MEARTPNDSPVHSARVEEPASAPECTDPHPSIGTLRGLMRQLRGDRQRHDRIVTRTFMALAVYRFGNWADEQPAPLRGVALRAYGWTEKVTRVVTGVHMDRRVRVGEGLHLIHAEGSISIHPSVVIGDRVGIMHNVTIGMEPSSTGAPRIGNDVFIGVGAAVLGPITVGDRSFIAANSLVISDVPPDSLAIGVPAKIYPRLGSAPSRGQTAAIAAKPGNGR